jgi:hypothetical protein
MADWKLPWTGRCRCERVRFTISAPPIITMACHCLGCRRMTASAFSLSVLVPGSGFVVTEGEVVLGGRQKEPPHFHCAFCKSWMFTRPPGMDAVNVRAMMLDAHQWFQPWVETARSEALPWAHTGAKHSFPDIPSSEVFPPLVADFAANAPRPD